VRCVCHLLLSDVSNLACYVFTPTMMMKFSTYSSSIPLVFAGQVSSRNSKGLPRAGALNKGGVGKIGDFRTLSRHISETVQDRTKVVVDH